jgi:UDP-N-acetyl-D-mannosaminuronate dehydrogenase
MQVVKRTGDRKDFLRQSNSGDSKSVRHEAVNAFVDRTESIKHPMKVSPELDVTAANIFIDDHPDRHLRARHLHQPQKKHPVIFDATPSAHKRMDELYEIVSEHAELHLDHRSIS